MLQEDGFRISLPSLFYMKYKADWSLCMGFVFIPLDGAI